MPTPNIVMYNSELIFSEKKQSDVSTTALFNAYKFQCRKLYNRVLFVLGSWIAKVVQKSGRCVPHVTCSKVNQLMCAV